MSAGKILVGLGTVAAVGVPAGLYMGGVISFSEEIPWRPLSEDTEFKHSSSSDPYHNKWGKKYARYLVGAGSPKTDSKVKDNAPWWDHKFKELETNKPSTGKFKNVNKATEGNNSLKTICDSAYKADSGKVKDTGVGNDDFSESDIWKYCSIGGTKIKTIKEAHSNNPYNGTPEKYGKKYETNLIAIENNDWFWKIRLQDLISSANNPATENSKFRISNHKEMTLDHIKNTCKAAYQQQYQSQGNNDYPETDVFKFCSLEGSKTQ